MNRYLVTYDLVGTSETAQDYKRLIERIKTYADWGKLQKSVWLIKSNKSATEVRDELWTHMDEDDRLAVIKITGTSATHNNVCTSEWFLAFMET